MRRVHNSPRLRAHTEVLENTRCLALSITNITYLVLSLASDGLESTKPDAAI